MARDDYDLLTALAMGVAVGAAIALLLRRGPRGRAPVGLALDAAGGGARWAGRRMRRSRTMRDRLPAIDDVVGELGEYLGAAREAISDAVSDEIKDIRKAVRKQRRRVGI